MKKEFPVEPVYQVLSLVFAIIVVHAIYISLVRPRAAAVLAEQTAQMQNDPDYVPERSAWVGLWRSRPCPVTSRCATIQSSPICSLATRGYSSATTGWKRGRYPAPPTRAI